MYRRQFKIETNQRIVCLQFNLIERNILLSLNHKDRDREITI